MTKKQIDKLVLESFTGNNLNLKKVEKVALQISRKDLKSYIRALKDWQRRNSIDIIATNEKYKKNLNHEMVKKIFPKKKIIYSIDPTLITGMRIVDADMVYDFNLKNTLENIVEHIRSQYD